MQRIICLALIVFFQITIGCSRSDIESNKNHKRAGKRTVAIIKFATHPALDEAESGIIEALEDAKKFDTALSETKIERYNANGNPQLAKQLAETVSRPEVSLIIAIATPVGQAVAKTPSNIPILYGAVADPEGTGIISSGRATGIKNVGENIIDHALSFIKIIMANKNKLGTIYNPSEQNSVYVQNIINSLAPKYGFEITQIKVTDKSQVASSAEVLTKKVDFIYSANDNTVNAAAYSVVAVAKSTKTPFFLGDLSTLKTGALAAIGLEYHSMGKDIGRIAIDILKGKSIKDIPPRNSPDPEIWINEQTLAYMGLQLSPQAKKMVSKYIKGNNN